MSENEGDVLMRDETGTEEDENDDSSGNEPEESVEEGDESVQKAKQAITCRNVTLNTLMDDGVIQAGSGVLSIDYLGQRFDADLLTSGKIKWQGSEEEFGTPSAWALHCKRLVNPIKRSGCGWASVKYKGKKLDIWKSVWARKHRTSSPFKLPNHSTSQFSPPQPLTLSVNVSTASDAEKMLTSTPLKSQISLAKSDIDVSIPKVLSLSPVSVAYSASALTKPDVLPPLLSSPTAIATQVTNTQSSTEAQKVVENTKESKSCQLGKDDSAKPKPAFFEQNTNLLPPALKSGLVEAFTNSVQPVPEHPVVATTPKRSEPPSTWPKENHRSGAEVVLKERKYVKYSNLGVRTADVDLNTLVRCEHFESHDKLQPFTVSLTTNAALLMDFHCHLTRSEVVGYLGGRWDAQKQHLNIEQSFPVLCRLSDKFKAPLVEDEIRRRMKARKMVLVGWYHSHPYCTAQPSVRDIDCQMAYQLKMRGSGSTYHPCIGFIEAPYEKSDEKPESRMQSYWVMPNLEHPSSYNIPMHISYILQRDLSLTEDILIDMRRLTEFYSGAPDRVRFKERWKDSVTYLDKIRTSLGSKLPEDQLDSGTFLDFMQQLVRDMK